MKKSTPSSSVKKPLLHIFYGGIILGLLFFLVDFTIGFLTQGSTVSLNSLILLETYGTILYLLTSLLILISFIFFAHIIFSKRGLSFKNILLLSISFTFFLLLFFGFEVLIVDFSLRILFVFISALCTYGFYNIIKRYWSNDVIYSLIFAITSYILAIVCLNLLIYIKIVGHYGIKNIKYIFLSLIIVILCIYLIRHCYKFFIKKKKIIKGVISIYPAIIIISIIPFLKNLAFDNGKNVSSIKDLNVVILTLDALRADCLGIYDGNVKTPNIDKLAKEGIVFENAFSQAPCTIPSMVSFFSSYNPSVNKINGHIRLSTEKVTLAEELRLRGYTTCAMVANFLLGESSGVCQGFNHYLILHHHAGTTYLYRLPIVDKLNKIFHKLFYKNPILDTTKILTEKALKFLKKNYRHSFYLWIHYMDPHDPYSAREEFCTLEYKGKLKPYFAPMVRFWDTPQLSAIRKGTIYLNREDKEYIRALYDAEVSYLDQKIGEILSEIEKLGIKEKTIIILTSDHGEEFWDHGDYYHGQSLYDELIKVPLIIKSPTLPKGKRINHITRLIDVIPTIREILHLPKTEKLQGHSLIKIIKNKIKKYHPAFSEENYYYEDRKSIRTQEYKLILGMDTGKIELYDIINDPYEKEDISTKKAKIAQKLTQQLLQIVAENKNYAAKFSSKIILEEEKEKMLDLKKRLKALGYIE